jgi:proteasome accessory factor B
MVKASKQQRRDRRFAQGSSTPSSRPPLERMMQIHRVVRAGEFPNATRLARELEVSTKSVHRDVEFMRDRLELPIVFDWVRNGYRYTEEVAAFPTFQITEGELLALMVAEKALQQYRGTHFERPLVSAFKKLAASLPETVSIHLPDWEQTISFHTSAEPILDLELFDQLAKATAGRRQLQLTYRKPGRRATEPRIIDPYHLANVNGEWFLFAFCHLRHDLRTFVPARIVALRETGRTFRRPKRFSLEKRLRDSFGVITGQGHHRVLIRFEDEVADYVREKRWHSSQTIKELPDGAVELGMKLSSLTEVHRWILTWGGQAVPLAPPALVEMVRAAAKRLLGRLPER